MRLVLLSLVSVYFLGCANTAENDSKSKSDTEWASEKPKPAAQVEVTNYESSTGKVFTVIEKKQSASLSRITVQGTGFPNTQEVYSLRDVDPIEVGLSGDIDGDGFEEIYLITRSTGSGSHASIYGFTSYNDKSYGQIYIPDLAENDPNFNGYMGHDRIGIQDSRLIREFPVYNKGDANNSPSGGYRVITYTLEKGEANYILKIESVSKRGR